MHRFVIAVGGKPPTEVEAYFSRADVAELSYSPTAHTMWRSGDGTAHIAGWSTGDTDHAIHNDGSITVWGGNIRIAEAPGRPDATSLKDALCSDTADPRSLLRDAYAIAHLDAESSGLAVGDDLSLHPLFIAHPTPDVTVLGNRSSLVAEVDALWRNSTPTRSAESASWMAFSGYVVGDGTGYNGVSQLPQGSWARIDAGRVSIETGPPIYGGDPGDRLDLEEFADAFEHEIADSLRHALELSARPELELTGGKDSRLILAVAHRVGLLQHFTVTTYGPQGIPDVRIAAELCGLLHVPHNHIRTRKAADTPTYSSLDRLRRHVHRSVGVSQIGDAVEPTPDGAIYISGLFGEYFRTDHPGEARNPAQSAAEAMERFPIQRRFGSAGILHQEVIERLGAEALAHVAAAAEHVREPGDLRAAFTTRFRFPAWQNPLVDRNMNAILPLANGALVRQVFRLPQEDRGLELPHRMIMERADPRIARHPLANSTWRKPKPKPKVRPKPPPRPLPRPMPAPLPPFLDRLRRLVPRPVRRGLHPAWAIVQRRRTPDPPPPPTPASRSPKPDPKPTTEIEPTPAIEGLSSVRKARDWLPVSRRDLTDLVESDPDNPVFEFVDRTAFLSHIAGDGPGDPLANMQVSGAITAFIWLGAHELPSRTDG